MDERYINNGGKLVEYFCDYLERHINDITNDITLREEFDDMWPVTKDYLKPEYIVSDEEAFRMFKHAFGIINEEQQDMTKNINEETVRNMVAENLRKMLKEATQLKKSPDDSAAIDRSFDAERYLAQAIQNAREAGMSDEDIQSVLQKNMRKNYNPKFGNGTLKYGKK